MSGDCAAVKEAIDSGRLEPTADATYRKRPGKGKTQQTLMPDPMKKTCRSCDAVITKTGSHAFSVTSDRDSNGCAMPVAPSTDVAQCWRDGICPCCGAPGLCDGE